MEQYLIDYTPIIEGRNIDGIGDKRDDKGFDRRNIKLGKRNLLDIDELTNHRGLSVLVNLIALV